MSSQAYDWLVAFCWSLGIGRDLSTPTSWAPPEKFSGEYMICFPSTRDYMTRQKALWIQRQLHERLGPDYLASWWRLKATLGLLHTAAAPGERFSSEKECLVCTAPQETLVRDPCGHASLCPGCRDTWLNRTPACPICREKIPFPFDPGWPGAVAGAAPPAQAAGQAEPGPEAEAMVEPGVQAEPQPEPEPEQQHGPASTASESIATPPARPEVTAR